MKKIDLHIHSYFSDGEYSPLEIFNIIKREKISAFSITDHNYVPNQLSKIKKLANKHKIMFLNGVEISSIDRETKNSIHILGYSDNFNVKKINCRLKTTIDGYNFRAKKIIKKLNNSYPNLKLDFNNLKRKNKEVYVSRNTIARELLHFLNNRVDLKEALRQAFIKEDDSWMLSVEKAIKIIRQASGIAILAHSGKILTKMGSNNYQVLLKRLISYGLGGIELYSSFHNEKQVNELKKIAKKHKLVITAGSDWHGYNYSPQRKLGHNLANEELNDFLTALK